MENDWEYFKDLSDAEFDYEIFKWFSNQCPWMPAQWVRRILFVAERMAAVQVWPKHQFLKCQFMLKLTFLKLKIKFKEKHNKIRA